MESLEKPWESPGKKGLDPLRIRSFVGFQGLQGRSLGGNLICSEIFSNPENLSKGYVLPFLKLLFTLVQGYVKKRPSRNTDEKKCNMDISKVSFAVHGCLWTSNLKRIAMASFQQKIEACYPGKSGEEQEKINFSQKTPTH